MFEVDLNYLGKHILSARKNCNLTQKELAAQTRLAVKTIQDIESGIKNPTYDTLSRLIARLGISADTLFRINPGEDDELQLFIGRYWACNSQNQKILLKAINFLAELLLSEQFYRDDTE